MPENFLQIQERGRDARGRFAKGHSGNPAGKPRGARNRTTLAALALLEREAKALTRKAVELALKGDQTALKLCLERVLAPRRGRPVPIALPPIKSPADLDAVMAAIIAAASRGEISPGEAFELAQVVVTAIRAIETSDFERRLAELEDEGAPAGKLRLVQLGEEC